MLTESRKALRASRTFRKLMISYFCIFLIPFLVLCATLMLLVSHYSKQEATTAHVQWVALMMEDLERFEKPMTDIQMTLQYDSSIQQTYSPANYTPSTRLIQRLSALKYASDDFRNIWFIPTDGDYLYSDTSTIAVDALLSWRYGGLNYDAASFRQAASGGTLPGVLKARDLQQGDDVFLFAYPLLRRDSHSYKWHYQYVVFVIPQTRLQKILGHTLAASGIGATLYYHEELLCQTAENARDTYRSYAPEEYKQNLRVGETSVFYGHTASHSLFCAENSGWKMEVSVQNAFAARRTMLWWLTLLALAILGVGFYFSFLTARNAYAPIAKIKCQSAQLVENDGEDSSYNDFAVINQHLLQLSAQREKLQQEMSANTDVLHNFLCYSLLYGHFDNLRSFQLPDSVRLKLSNARLRVGFLLTGRSAAEIRAQLKKEFMGEVSFWCTCSARPEGVVVVLAYRNMEDEQLITRLRTLADRETMLGLSSAGEDMRLIPLMALQAVFALNRQMLVPGRIHEYASLSAGHQQLSGAEENEAADVGSLMLCISEQTMLEADKAYRLLKGLMLFLEENPEFASGCMAVLPIFLEPLRSVREGRRADLLALGPIVEKYLRPLSEEPVLAQMRRYIEMHYMESEFSFKNMAADFSMAESGLSNYFKKNCGKSLMDYLTELRIQQAINLLDNTEISIQDIGALVGYLNPNSFIRRFKQVMQMTPGEYRRSTREEM